MSEEGKQPSEGYPPPPAGDAWREMGRQFQQLGESLSAAFRAAWNDERVRREAEHAKDGLEALATEVGKAVTEMTRSADVRQATGRAVDAARAAGEETVHEIRPHLVDALRQLNRELQKLIDSMETGKRPPGPE